MPCSSPNIMGYNPFDGYTFRGPRYLERHIDDIVSDDGFAQEVPCGKCDLCRVQRRYSRALRIILEAESWPESTYFITLTYSDEHLGCSDLVHSDWSQFMKDFRQTFCQVKYCKIRDRGTLREGKQYSLTFKKIKQVMTGEYGDTFGRKHFHGIIFNHDFTDLVPTGTYSKKGNAIHTSASLQAVWKKGFVQVEKVNFDLALYVSAYVTDANDPLDVNEGHIKKQYGLFGRGIGEEWIRKYWRQVLVAGKVMTSEGDYPIPRYFLDKIKEWFPDDYAKWKSKKIVEKKRKLSKLIAKGDGPLRRAKAKGRIFNKSKQRRLIDGEGPRSVQRPEF